MRKGSIQPILLLLITFVSITAFLIGKNIENRQEIRKQAAVCTCIDDGDCGVYGNMYCYGAPCGECRVRSNPSPSPTSTPSPTTYTCSLNNGTCIYPGEPCVTRLLSFSCENNYDCCQNYVAPTPSPTSGCTNIKDATECAYDPACLWSNNQCIDNNNCLNGSCYQTCTPGQKQCETDANGINWSKTCASNGISWESVSCGYGCSSGICNSAPSPSPISFPILVPSPSPDITIPKSNNYICSKDTDCASNHCYPTAVQGGTIGLCGTTDQPPQITQLIKLGGTCGTNAYDRTCETPNVCYNNKCTDPAVIVADTQYANYKYMSYNGYGYTNGEWNSQGYSPEYLAGINACQKDPQGQVCKDWNDNVLNTATLGLYGSISGGIQDIALDARKLFYNSMQNQTWLGQSTGDPIQDLKSKAIQTYLTLDILSNILTLGSASIEDVRKSGMTWLDVCGQYGYSAECLLVSANAGTTGTGLVTSLAANPLLGKYAFTPQNVSKMPVSSTYNAIDNYYLNLTKINTPVNIQYDLLDPNMPGLTTLQLDEINYLKQHGIDIYTADLSSKNQINLYHSSINDIKNGISNGKIVGFSNCPNANCITLDSSIISDPDTFMFAITHEEGHMLGPQIPEVISQRDMVYNEVWASDYALNRVEYGLGIKDPNPILDQLDMARSQDYALLESLHNGTIIDPIVEWNAFQQMNDAQKFIYQLKKLVKGN